MSFWDALWAVPAALGGPLAVIIYLILLMIIAGALALDMFEEEDWGLAWTFTGAFLLVAWLLISVSIYIFSNELPGNSWTPLPEGAQ